MFSSHHFIFQYQLKPWLLNTLSWQSTNYVIAKIIWFWSRKALNESVLFIGFDKTILLNLSDSPFELTLRPGKTPLAIDINIPLYTILEIHIFKAIMQSFSSLAIKIWMWQCDRLANFRHNLVTSQFNSSQLRKFGNFYDKQAAKI